MDKKSCPLCGNEADTQLNVKQGSESEEFFDCKVCGWFTAESGLLHRIVNRGEFKDKLYILSALSRKNYDRQLPREIGHGITPFVLSSQTIEEHLESLSLPADPLDRVDRLLRLVHDRTESFNAGGRIDAKTDYPLLFLRTPVEFEYISRIASQMGYVDGSNPPQMVLTPKGWERERESRSSMVRTKQVFVAMWFSPETDAAWLDGFQPALRDDLGYEPIRIDKREHINKIDDEIVSAIRTSGFVVADFTGDRGGVYFEAGLAMGLGKPVVWCCRDDDWAKKLHFDTRQYSHIMWKTALDLRARLVARIKAVISPILP